MNIDSAKLRDPGLGEGLYAAKGPEGCAMSVTVISNIRIIALRDLRDVKKEIESYPDDASLWRTVPGITNPGGTLALHLAGNM